MIRVERIEPDDDRFPLVETLDRLLLPEAPPRPDTEWWIAWDTEAHELAGYAGAVWLSGSIYFLSRAGVARAYRGKGLQKRLIRARVAAGRKAGATMIVTYTLPHNAASSNNLIACGFRTYNPFSAYGGGDAIYWFHKAKTPRMKKDRVAG